jgi:mRNA interferase RelE/StbE
MPYRLKVTATAERQIDRLPPGIQQRVRRSLLALTSEPRPRGCAKLRGGVANYRIRVGGYRVLYEVEDASQTVTILKVKHRRDVYRG